MLRITTGKVMLKVSLFFAVIASHCTNKAELMDIQKYFRKINDHGDSLAAVDVISSHFVHSDVECSLKCLEEQSCVGYNYKEITSKKDQVNCQIAGNASTGKDQNIERNGDWILYQEVVETFHAANSVVSEKKWTLVARFSNNDAKNWMKIDGSFWYDVVTEIGDPNNPLENADMISPAFWQLNGNEIKITRSDDASHTALLQTTCDCLQGGTFRSKITSYGDFRNGVVWANDVCRGSCPVLYGGQYETTAGFEQHDCSSTLQANGWIGFWCDWAKGDGAVLMIGGGGSACKRADHGIGITEKNKAQFGVSGDLPAYDFGNDANTTTALLDYSLNLWVR